MNKSLSLKLSVLLVFMLITVTLLSTVSVPVLSATGTADTFTYSATSSFSGTQGANQWYYMKKEISTGTYTNLAVYDAASPAKWKESSGYPYVRNAYFHPQNSYDAVKKWVAPQAGSVDITGIVYRVNTSSDGVVAKISKNATQLWSATVTSSADVTPSGVSNISVNAGDSIYFIINKNGTASYDETHWEPVVTLTTGITYQGEGYDSMSGVSTTSCSEGTAVTSIDNNDYMVYNNVNFKGGYKTLQARVAATTTGGKLEFRLGSISGTLIGTMTIGATGGTDVWETQTIALAGGTTGTQNLYIKAVGASGICNLNWFKLTCTQYRGATMPFTTYEAENATLGGSYSLSPNANQKLSSRSKGYVYLDSADDYVQFNNVVPATKMTLRYSVPQSSTSSPKVYINGTEYTQLNLTSEGCYAADSTNIRFYYVKDIDINLIGGENVKIQYYSGSGVSIDCVDFEVAPVALSMPANYYSITSYGATGNDTTDDTTAIQNCINAANAQNPKKGVWIPAGTYYVATSTTVPSGITVRGAGLWYSKLYGYNADAQGSTSFLINITGDNVGIYDLDLDSNVDHRIPACFALNNRYSYLTVENCRFNRFCSAIPGWGQEGHNCVSRNLRIRETYADGIHPPEGGDDNLVENCFVRGSGDDCIAFISQEENTIAYRNIAQFNTCECNYSGRGIAMTGNYNSIIRDNIIDSSARFAGLYIAAESGTYPGREVYNCRFIRNTIRYSNQPGNNHGAIEMWPALHPITGAKIELNYIEKGATYGIHLDYYGIDSGGSAAFNYNTVVTETGYFPNGNFVQEPLNTMTVTKTGNTGF